MSRDQEFLKLISVALDACEKARLEALSRGESWMVEDAATARSQFGKIAEQVKGNTLAPSQGGGLGITRALSEWAPAYLYAAGEAVEDYYMRNW